MAYNLGNKRLCYRRNPSVHHVVLVWHDRVKVDHWARGVDQSWSFQETQGLDHGLSLPEIDLTVPLDEIYEDILL